VGERDAEASSALHRGVQRDLQADSKTRC